MEDLLGRHKKYLRAAYEVAPDSDSTFDPYMVGDSIGFTKRETEDAISLLRDKYIRAAGRNSDDKPIHAVTKYGREVARQIGDDAQRDRKQRRVNFIYAAWLILLTLLQAGAGKWIQTVVERAMKEPQAPSTSTAPTTNP